MDTRVNRNWFASIFVLLILLGFAGSVQAAPGDLDTTFGIGGKVTTDFGSESDLASAVALQSDGSILVAGGNFLARYNSDGTVDVGFGSGGKVITDFDTTYGASAILVQADGKILVAGTIDVGGFPFNALAVARYHPDGTRDTTFGVGGMGFTHFEGYYEGVGKAMALQSDGKVVVAGRVFRSPDGTVAIAVARFGADGTLDAGFGSGGKIVTTFGSGSAAYAVAIQPDNKILVGGWVYVSTGGYQDFLLARFTTSGTLDTGFGNGGIAVADFIGFNDEATDIAIQVDGRIIVAGRAHLGSGVGFGFGLVRYNSNGTLDITFGMNGKTTTAFGNLDTGVSIRLQGDGKVVAAASVNYDGSNFSPDFGLVRYNPDGTLDLGFGTNGRVATDFESPGRAYAHDLAIQKDGKIIIVGNASIGPQYDVALTRYDVLVSWNQSSFTKSSQ